jgi:hypothetical protein
MHKARSFFACVGLSLLALGATRAHARQAVTVRLVPETAAIQQGDTLRFNLTFTNRSGAPVRLWVPLHWGSIHQPTMLLKIRAPNGVEMTLEPAKCCLQGSYFGPEEYPEIPPGDSLSLCLGIGHDLPSRSGNPRSVSQWGLTAQSAPARSMQPNGYDSADVWVGFAGAGEYAVNADYDLRRASEPLTPIGTTPSRVPLLRQLLHTGRVRVVVMPRR